MLHTEAVQVIAILVKIAENLLRKSPRLSHGEEANEGSNEVAGDFGAIKYPNLPSWHWIE